MHKILLVVLLPFACLSWWDVGHMLVSSIAQIRLNMLSPIISSRFKDVVTSINSLCDNKSQTFVESACWPDDIKQYSYYMDIWNELHFIDTPYIQKSVIPTINYTTQKMNSIETIKQAIKVLKINPTKNTAQRALFARYLVHLVGDVHQPLHSCALYNETYPSGDAGGNFLKIKRVDGVSMNFHSFWDSGGYMIQNDSWSLNRPLNQQNLTALRMATSDLIKQYGDQIQSLATNIDPQQWAQQAFQFAKNVSYPRLSYTNVADQQYTSLTYQTSKRQITLAGYRLANIVISIYEQIHSQQYSINKQRIQQNKSQKKISQF